MYIFKWVKNYVILCVKIYVLIYFRKILVVFMCNFKEPKKLSLLKDSYL
jgi:hypothetical protein